MEDPQALREKAKRYRRMALAIRDQQTIDTLPELADRYEALAVELEAYRRSLPGEGRSRATDSC
jgi:hypothetical protein